MRHLCDLGAALETATGMGTTCVPSVNTQTHMLRTHPFPSPTCGHVSFCNGLSSIHLLTSLPTLLWAGIHLRQLPLFHTKVLIYPLRFDPTLWIRCCCSALSIAVDVDAVESASVRASNAIPMTASLWIISFTSALPLNPHLHQRWMQSLPSFPPPSSALMPARPFQQNPSQI